MLSFWLEVIYQFTTVNCTARYKNCVQFQALTVVTVKNTVVWEVTLFSQNFVPDCCVMLQRKRIVLWSIKIQEHDWCWRKKIWGSDFRCTGDLLTVFLCWFYCVTGNTPRRSDFSYPRVLAATSPHERILARFREASGATIPHFPNTEVSLNNTLNQHILMNMKVPIFTGCRRLLNHWNRIRPIQSNY